MIQRTKARILDLNKKKQETQTTRNGISYVIVNFNVTIALYVFDIHELRRNGESTHTHVKVSKPKKKCGLRQHEPGICIAYKISKTLSLLQLMVY